LLVVLSTLAGAVALGVAIGLPGAPARPARRKPGPPVRDAPYRAYRQVAEQLSWAAVSPRHYDLMTRPMLVEIAAARLADRHGVDLYTQPAAACDLLGPDVWRWLDPTAVPTRDSQPPGVGRDVLRRVVERLERL
jgi:hypothetical protein